MTAVPMTMRHLNRATLARQMLLARHDTTVPAAVERLLGVQAQMPKPPFVGLWTRVHGVTREGVADLLRTRVLVRATTMRGTLHLMTAADYLALRTAMQAGLDHGLRAILGARLGGLDRERMVEVATAHLAQPRTFDEVRAHLLAAFPGGDERAMGYSVRLTLPLVQVPGAAETWAYAAQAPFIAARTWLKRPPARGDAPDALVLRYIAGYGPVTVTDAQAWLGIPALKPVFERLRPSLITLRGPGKAELFDLPDAPRPDAETPAPVRLLPEWDNLLIGRGDERFVPAARRKAVFLPGLRVAATLLVDGTVAGTWTVERKKAAATLTVTPFGKLSKAVRAEVEQEGEAALQFLEPDAATRAVRVG